MRKPKRVFSDHKLPAINQRVTCQSHWGFVKGVITIVYPSYNFTDDDGEVIHCEAQACVLCDEVPPRWPYSTKEFAPLVETLHPETP